MSFDPADHTIEEVHEHLAEHPEDTDAVLAAEQARGDDARSTLVSSLETSQRKPGNGEATTTDAEAAAKPEDERISPPGEYPEEGTPGIWGYHSNEPGVQAGRQEA